MGGHPPNPPINMKILQLCCFTNLWSEEYQVESWDLRNKKDIMEMDINYPKQFDVVVAAPPCDQFTKANAHHWEKYPGQFIKIAKRCLELCKQTGSKWIIENPPGRIEKLIPELKQYRLMTWNSPSSNKEYVIYGNFIIMNKYSKRYVKGKEGKRQFKNMTKKQREKWDQDLVNDIMKSL